MSGKFKKQLSLLDLTFIGLGAIFGSGWLFAASHVSAIAGPAGILSWFLGGFAVLLLGIVYCELGAALPRAGGVVRYPVYSHGPLLGYLMGFITLIAFSSLIAIEVVASRQYAAAWFPGLTKAGSSDLVDVYEYAEPVRAHGLVFMDTPGYDPISATGQVAGGANLIAFTTGRGSAYGCAPSPSIKLATNTRLWETQEDDMDVNCGGIADASTTIEERGEHIYRLMLRIASGERSKSEQHGYGQNEFVPWQIGAVT